MRPLDSIYWSMPSTEYPLLQLVVVFSAPLLLTFPSWLAVMYLGIFYVIARPR